MLGPEEASRLNQSITLVLLGEKLYREAVDHVDMPKAEGTRAATALLSQLTKQRKTMSYSLQLYSLRNAMQEDLPGTIKKVAEIGYTQVEPCNFVATAEELGAALKDNGLTAPSGLAPLLSQDQDEIFAAAKELGISTVIDPYVPAEHRQSAEDIQASAAKLNAAAKKGAEYGIRVGGQDPVELPARLGDRVKFVHIKDGPGTTDTKAQQPAGQGTIPVLDVVAAATSLEVGVVEFDDYAGDIFEGTTESLAFLQNNAAQDVKA